MNHIGLLFWLVIACNLNLGAGELHTFTSKDGRTMDAAITALAGDSLTIRRDDGTTFTVTRSLFSDEDQPYIDAWGARQDMRVSGDALNEAIGHQLFADANLWDDNEDDAAARLGWDKESGTATQASFRKYPRGMYRFLGARPFSAALYGANGKAASLSLVFANKGDSFSAKGSGEDHFDSDARVDMASLDRAIDADEDAVEEKLTALLGEPQRQSFGEGSAYRRVSRWDWNGHAFLLSKKDEEFVALSITPTGFADQKGRGDRTRDAEIREIAKKNVEHSKNGDVLIRNIPMVDQGPKGYCVPATFERCMRYMNIPADMYLLAMAGETSAGGGSYIDPFIDGVKSDVTRNGRSMRELNIDMEVRDVARFINDGLPLLWVLYSTDNFNTLANAQTTARKQVDNWETWENETIKQFEGLADKIGPDPTRGHVAMVIGYNKKTNEVAVSDSWGPQYEVRWVIAEAAERVSRGFYLIGF